MRSVLRNAQMPRLTNFDTFRLFRCFMTVTTFLESFGLCGLVGTIRRCGKLGQRPERVAVGAERIDIASQNGGIGGGCRVRSATQPLCVRAKIKSSARSATSAFVVPTAYARLQKTVE